MDYYSKALNDLKDKDFTSAIVNFTEALNEGLYDSKLHYYLAICYANLGYHAEALEEIKEAIGQDDILESEKIHLLILKGYMLCLENKNELSITALQDALKINKDNPVVYSAIGYNLYKQGDYNQALEYFKKGLDIEPDNSNLNNSYGYMLIDSESDIEQGLEHCKKALQKNPGSPAVMDSVAWGYFKKGDLKNSLTNILTAIKYKTSLKEITEHYHAIARKIKNFLNKKSSK